MDANQLPKRYTTAWTRFNSNVGALYSFFAKVTEIADELDKEKIKKVSIELGPLLKENPESVEADLLKYFPSIDDLDFFPDIRNDDSIKEMMSDFQDSKFIDRILEWEKKHPYKSQKFLKTIYSAFSDPPISGITLRKSMLVMLMTFLEMLFEDLLQIYLVSEDGIKENATKHVDDGSLDGWGKRLEFLKKIGLLQNVQYKYKDEIIEIAKRRNLIVHNDGIVDESYIKKAPQKYKGLTPGTIFVVSTQYFQRAIDIVYSLGFSLCMAGWALNGMDQSEQNKKVNEFIISSLNQKRFSLVLDLTSNFRNMEMSQIVSQRMLVNRAIAYRELGEDKEVKRIVSTLFKSEHDWQIDIAISMLLKDYTSLQLQLEKASKKYSDFSKLFLWPLFDPIRDEPWFRIALTRRNKAVLKQLNASRRKR